MGKGHWIHLIQSQLIAILITALLRSTQMSPLSPMSLYSSLIQILSISTSHPVSLKQTPDKT